MMQMQIPFESLAKDKKVLIKISKELLEAMSEVAEATGVTRVAFVRIALTEFIKLHKAKKLKPITSKYEKLPQSGRLAMRLSTALFDEIRDAAKANGQGLHEAFREAIERALKYS